MRKEMSNPSVISQWDSDEQQNGNGTFRQKKEQTQTLSGGMILAILLVFLVIFVVGAYFQYRMFKASPKAYVAGEGIATLGSIFGGRR